MTRMKGVLVIVFSVGFLLGVDPAGAEGSESDFVSLHFSRANVRSGPGQHYPILWVYTKKGVPLRIVGRFGEWRRVRDWEGQEGWMHRRLLRRDRRGIVLAPILARHRPGDDAPGSVRIEAGVLVDLLDCVDAWCRVEIAGYRGWVPRRYLWGGS